ncbi:MAG: hypothetical protein R3240_12945 [Gammaproteobacteria bacterium]|nr:hypothetical protein [Gammaproteobacteria bacterium]
MKLSSTGKLVLVLVSIPVVLFLLVVLYYQFDEDLRPEVVEILNYQPEKILANENAYYTLLALFADKDAALDEKGLQIVTAAEKRYASFEELSIVSITDIEGAEVIKLNIDEASLCGSDARPDCLEDILNRKAFYRKILQENDLIIGRLRHLYHYQYFQESPAVVIVPKLKTVHRLLLADIGLKWINGKHQAAVLVLRHDLEFWRHVSSSDISLITRMIAESAIDDDLHILSEFVSDCSNCINDKLIEKQLLRPITSSEMDMTRVFGFEYRTMYHDILKLIAQSKKESLGQAIQYDLFFKQNSVFNKMYTMYDQTIKLSKCEIDNYANCYAAYMNEAKKDIDFSSAEFLKDPVGEVIYYLAKPTYHNYVWRSYRKELLRRLIYVKFLLHKNNVSENDLQGYLNGLPKNLKNPVMHQAIEWEGEMRRLKMTMPENMEIEPVSIDY